MIIKIVRRWKHIGEPTTLGDLYIDDQLFGVTLEDMYRGQLENPTTKISPATCIPNGTYNTLYLWKWNRGHYATEETIVTSPHGETRTIKVGEKLGHNVVVLHNNIYCPELYLCVGFGHGDDIDYFRGVLIHDGTNRIDTKGYILLGKTFHGGDEEPIKTIFSTVYQDTLAQEAPVYSSNSSTDYQIQYTYYDEGRDFVYTNFYDNIITPAINRGEEITVEISISDPNPVALETPYIPLPEVPDNEISIVKSIQLDSFKIKPRI